MEDFKQEQLDALHKLLHDPENIDRLLRIADEDEKRQWLLTVMRKTATWVAAVAGAIVLFWDGLKRVVAGLLP